MLSQPSDEKKNNLVGDVNWLVHTTDSVITLWDPGNNITFVGMIKEALFSGMLLSLKCCG
jgi:hypothetical protein